MKYALVVLLGLALSSMTVAAEVGSADAPDWQMMSMHGSDRGAKDKAEIELTMKDGSKQKFEIPYYQFVSDLKYSCWKKSNHRRECDNFENKIIDLLIKKARKKVLSDEEMTLLAELAEDSKIYDANNEKLTPVCSEKNSKGFVIVTSMMPSCESLSAKQLKAAPYVDAGVSNIQLADEASKFRYKAPADVREKLASQNLELQQKWSARQ